MFHYCKRGIILQQVTRLLLRVLYKCVKSEENVNIYSAPGRWEVWRGHEKDGERGGGWSGARPRGEGWRGGGTGLPMLLSVMLSSFEEKVSLGSLKVCCDII